MSSDFLTGQLFEDFPFFSSPSHSSVGSSPSTSTDSASASASASTSDPTSTTTKKTLKPSQQIRKWKPKNSRFATIMAMARKKAEVEHAELEKHKSLKPSRRPSRAVTSRQKSSKRSAEICRSKMGIYIKLLEEEHRNEIQQYNQLQHSLLLQSQANAALMAKIAELEKKKCLQKEHQLQQLQQKYSAQVPFPSTQPTLSQTQNQTVEDSSDISDMSSEYSSSGSTQVHTPIDEELFSDFDSVEENTCENTRKQQNPIKSISSNDPFLCGSSMDFDQMLNSFEIPTSIETGFISPGGLIDDSFVIGA